MNTLPVVVLLLCVTLPIQAQTLYKIIDEQGKISYTSVAPGDMQDVEILAPPPEPDEADVSAAQEQLKQYRKQRLEREQAQIEADKEAAKFTPPASSSYRVERYIERQVVPVLPVRPGKPGRPVRPIRPINRPVQLPSGGL